MLNFDVRLSGILAIALLAAVAPRLQAQQLARAPDAAKTTAAIVAAANPLAVDAGIAILRKGGSAADAAVAIQAMLGLVEPQSSGIGGGGFMLYYEAKSGVVTALDGREKAQIGRAHV